MKNTANIITNEHFVATGFPTGGDIVTGSPTVPPEFEYSSTTPMSTGEYNSQKTIRRV